ncbi:hypothetical protein BEN47_05870 [Hymenobacter lapidarius]|uniref:Uncharacterized protein n=1 Tax=Hymenobacter lapidarius TaxID=1908237 RepID=A0A1G1SS73_9BACT|nr:hypothetical protein BEN47_05870 [Hymenobacter lapidarius]
MFRRFVSLALALLVLTASVGLSVQRQTCRMSGNSTIDVSVLGKAARLVECEALERAAAVPIPQDACCDFSSHLHKLTTPAHGLAAKVLLPAPLPAVLPALGPTWPTGVLVPNPESGIPRWFAADSSPPPLGGRGLLALVCTLLV